MINNVQLLVFNRLMIYVKINKKYLITVLFNIKSDKSKNTNATRDPQAAAGFVSMSYCTADTHKFINCRIVEL